MSCQGENETILPFETTTVNGVVSYRFQDVHGQVGGIPLKGLVRAFAPGVVMGKSVSADQLYLNLGKLRAAASVVQEYNECVLSLRKLLASGKSSYDLDAQHQLYRHHAEELFTVVAYQTQNPLDTLTVSGLDALIRSIEEVFKDTISTHRSQISGGTVHFDGLGELFLPGMIVEGPTSLGSGIVKAGYLVRNGYFEEKRTLFGMEKSFKLELEFLVNFGNHFVLIRCEEIFAGWGGAKNKAIAELAYQPISNHMLEAFTRRGEKCMVMTSDSLSPSSTCRFVQYDNGAFYPHGQQRTNLVAPSSSTGRIVVDCSRGLLLGHHPSQGSDEATLGIMQAAGRYKRLLGNAHLAERAPSSGSQHHHKLQQTVEGMLILTNLTQSLCPLAWPSVVGFSFALKCWGHVLVESLHEIEFNDNAFDLLVLSPERKRLIKALVRFGGKEESEAQFGDIIAGKSGGSVFLLHGPPGVGKTLTAEAIAELLHRPLYYVTMGELGTNPEELEKRLSAVLDLCHGWDAITIIDEADVFLEKRVSGPNTDVVRNAMVCVMLRLIEYHQGILFLTTNRVMVFDPAFESRVTVALKYDHLTPAAREKVWRNLIGKLGGIEVGQLDYGKLGQVVLNGRQIKNAVRLAVAMAVDERCPLTQDLIDEMLAITLLGRMEMESDRSWWEGELVQKSSQ